MTQTNHPNMTRSSHGLFCRCCISTKDLYDNITCNSSGLGVKLSVVFWGIGTPIRIDMESEHDFFQKESRLWRVRFQLPAVSFGGSLYLSKSNWLSLATFQVNLVLWEKNIFKWITCKNPSAIVKKLQMARELLLQSCLAMMSGQKWTSYKKSDL